MFSADKIREDFPILKREVHGRKLIYLDNAATTQKPKEVLEILQAYYTNYNANIHRGVHKLSEEATELYDEAHVKVGKFINAKHPFEETIFLRNATEAINLVMYSWARKKLKKGDEILTTIMEHHSNIVPWQLMKEKGIKVRFADITDNGTLDMNDLKNKINKKTKLVACVHGSNVLGTINDVKTIGKIAHQNGAMFLVDGAQSAPHFPVDVQDIDCDFFAFSGHKMLAPTGIGALYAKKHLLEEMAPFLYGGDMISEVKIDSSKWNSLPWKFEAGTPNIGGGIALGAAVDYLEKLGMQNVEKYEKELTKYALGKFSQIKDVIIYGPKEIENRGGVLTFNIRGIHPHDVAGILDSEFSIAVRSGHHCAQPLIERLDANSTTRASFYIYNTKEEIDMLVKGIKKVKEVFRR